jgi:hypothetical protein
MASKTIIARYSHDKDTFEILVNSDLAYDYITGKRSDPVSVLELRRYSRMQRKGRGRARIG